MKDINLSDAFDLIKEWRRLETAERDVAFAKVQFARKLRRRFQAGSNGDRDFKSWCIANLKQTEAETEVMFSLSIAGAVFKDAVEYSAAGGINGIAKIWGTGTAAEQEAVMRTAKEQALTMQTVLSRRNASRPAPIRTPAQDARTLAKYLAQNADTLPTSVREIVARYVPLGGAKAEVV